MTIQEKQEKIRNKAELFRTSAKQIAKVKAAVMQFDGKVYNCKFDEAIRALSDDEARFYVSNSYGWFYIQCLPAGTNNYREDRTLLSAYSCVAGDRYNRVKNDDSKVVFSDKKRIDAKKMCVLLTEKYGELMQNAGEFDRAADNLEMVLDQIEKLKKMISAIEAPLPYEVREIAGLVRRGW